MVIIFVSSKDSNETGTMYLKSGNIEIVLGNETNETMEELFNSLLQKYQKGLDERMRRSEFVFDSVGLLYYKLHKRSLNRDGLYTYSPNWLQIKTTRINSKNIDNKCFQYTVTVALNYQNIKSNPQRITKIKPFINQYNWKEISSS